MCLRFFSVYVCVGVVRAHHVLSVLCVSNHELTSGYVSGRAFDCVRVTVLGRGRTRMRV